MRDRAMVTHQPHKLKIEGSIPSPASKNSGVAQWQRKRPLTAGLEVRILPPEPVNYPTKIDLEVMSQLKSESTPPAWSVKR